MCTTAHPPYKRRTTAACAPRVHRTRATRTLSASRRRPTNSPVWASRAAPTPEAPRRALPTRVLARRVCCPARGPLRSTRWSTSSQERRAATAATYPRQRRGCVHSTRTTGGVGATRARSRASMPCPRPRRGSSAATRHPSPPWPRHPSQAPRHSRPYAREARPPNLYLRREPYRATPPAASGHRRVPPQHCTPISIAAHVLHYHVFHCFQGSIDTVYTAV